MQVRLHKNSRTTLAIRQEIRNSPFSAYALAKKYGIAWETANKWKKAETLEDKSSRPHKLNTTLTKEEEELICFERKQFKKTIEDIFFTLEDKIPNLYPMKIYRCLKRHNLATLPSDFVAIKFKHPLTNGMVENFNKRIKNNLLTKYLFSSIFDLNGKILKFVDDYNQNKRLKNLNYQTPA